MHSSTFTSLAQSADERSETIYAYAELPNGSYAVVTHSPDRPDASAYSFYPSVNNDGRDFGGTQDGPWDFGPSTYSMTRQRAMLEFAARLVQIKDWMTHPKPEPVNSWNPENRIR